MYNWSSVDRLQFCIIGPAFDRLQFCIIGPALIGYSFV